MDQRAHHGLGQGCRITAGAAPGLAIGPFNAPQDRLGRGPIRHLVGPAIGRTRIPDRLAQKLGCIDQPFRDLSRCFQGARDGQHIIYGRTQLGQRRLPRRFQRHETPRYGPKVPARIAQHSEKGSHRSRRRRIGDEMDGKLARQMPLRRLMFRKPGKGSDTAAFALGVFLPHDGFCAWFMASVAKDKAERRVYRGD